MQNIVEFTDVNKKFSSQNIYSKDLSFKINSGDKFVVSGKSGSGKSTILNLIMGFLFCDSGKIKIFQNELNHSTVNKFRQSTNYIPQSFNFLKGMKVKEVIMKPFTFHTNIHNLPNDNQINSLLDKLDLPLSLLDSEISELSGGERQRICAVIALLLDRDIIIMDEPTSNLDKINTSLVIDLFLNSDKTLIISTHDSNISDRCNNILVLE
jgi:putative ABC transport system ATP-binding protein